METTTVLFDRDGEEGEDEEQIMGGEPATGTNKSHRDRRSSHSQHRARGLRRGGYGWITLMRDLGGGAPSSSAATCASVLFFRILPLALAAGPPAPDPSQHHHPDLCAFD
jgi:hypothetical protein